MVSLLHFACGTTDEEKSTQEKPAIQYDSVKSWLWSVVVPILLFMFFCGSGHVWMYSLWHVAWKVATFISPVVDEPLRKARKDRSSETTAPNESPAVTAVGDKEVTRDSRKND